MNSFVINTHLINVLMENDWVDLLVDLADKVNLYEINSDRYAADCMLKGIRQALGYAYRIKQQFNKPVELVIAGPNLIQSSITINFLA